LERQPEKRRTAVSNTPKGSLKEQNAFSGCLLPLGEGLNAGGMAA